MKLLSNKNIDLTVGRPLSLLVTFTVPLFLGNLFQLLYSTVDSYVVGNYVGKEALAAVGTTAPVINMLIGLFSGLATGAGVVIAQYFGARDEARLRRAVHTAMLLSVVLCVVLTVVGLLTTTRILRYMSVPDEVLPEADAYLYYYFIGISGMLIYNMGAGVLRAVGDLTRPFYYLVISSVLNVVLDFLFVCSFGWGVAGAAIATSISQAVSAVLVVIELFRARGSYRMRFGEMRFTPSILKTILRVGTPTALQMAITSFSNVFVQAYINRFSTDCMAGWTTYSRVDAFLMLPITSFALGVTTFVGQNIGAENLSRARHGVRLGIWMALIVTLILMVPILVFAPGIIGLFNDSPGVVEYGTAFLRFVSPFYIFCCFNQNLSGALRGAGDSRPPMIFMLLSFVVLRQVYLFILWQVYPDSYLATGLAYPVGWVLCCLMTSLYYRFGHWERRCLTRSQKEKTAVFCAD